MAILAAVALFVLLFGAVAAFGYRYYVRPGRMLERLSVAMAADAIDDSNVVIGKPGAIVRGLVRLGQFFPASSADARLTRRALIAAGLREEFLLQAFRGFELSGSAICTLVALLVHNKITANPVLQIAAIVASGALGYFTPAMLLEMLIGKRRQKIQMALPDALDLMVVCTEAGCSLDRAILRVSQELKSVHPEICEEMSLIGLEMLAGNSRTDGLRNFASRTGDPEIAKLTSVLIQADRFGSSIAEALRTQADYLRTRRRQQAEERAGKVGVKLVFPIFFFCLPSLFIVAAGPGILQLVKNLLPMMADFK